ncbi:MAG: transporter substrate-binding domain-containing protein [Pseudomonadota bacterium]
MNIMKKGVLVVCLTLMTALFAVSLTYAQQAGIRVVYTEWFPYTYQDKHQAAGFEIEILKAVFKTLDVEVEVEFVVHPWKRCLDDLKMGRADALVSLLKTPERESYAYFPENHISLSRTVFFTRTDRPISFGGNYQNLSGYSIGLIMGFSYGDVFDKAVYLKKDPAYNAEMLIKKLLAGRNDLAAENQAVVNASAEKMGVKAQIRFLEPPIHTQKLYVGFSRAKNLKQLCQDFSSALGQFKQSGAYKKIIEKYGVNYSDMQE